MLACVFGAANYNVFFKSCKSGAKSSVSFVGDSRSDRSRVRNADGCEDRQYFSVSSSKNCDVVQKFKCRLQEKISQFNALTENSGRKIPEHVVCVNGDVISDFHISDNSVVPIGTSSSLVTAYILLKIVTKKYGNRWKSIMHKPLDQVDALKEFCHHTRSYGRCDWLSKVSMHDLMTHTSGIMGHDYVKNVLGETIFKNMFGKTNMIKMIHSFSYDCRLHECKVFEFSMLNYVILSLIIEYISNDTFNSKVNDLAKANNIKTLKNACGGTIDELFNKLELKKRQRGSLPLPLDVMQGSMSLTISMSDLYLFISKLMNDKIFDIMVQQREPGNDMYCCYGFPMEKYGDNIVLFGTFLTYINYRLLAFVSKKHNLCVLAYVDSMEYCNVIHSFISSIRKELDI